MTPHYPGAEDHGKGGIPPAACNGLTSIVTAHHVEVA